MTELRTERLLLRPPVVEDLPVFHAATGADPGVPWNQQARTPAESEEKLRGRIEHFERHGFGLWAVEWRDTGEYLGEAGLQHFEDGESVEVGYYLGRPAWGRGVATEAGAAALRHGFEVLGLSRIVAVVRPENSGSKRVLAKLGLRFAAVEDHYGIRDVELWEIAAEA